MVSLTIFDSIYDNKTVKRVDYNSFDDFEKVLYKLANSDKYQKKTDAPLISPATYKTGTTRANANVISWGGFGIVDVDDYEGSIEDIHEKYSKYKYVCYSTASSTKAHPKFRLVFPLTRDVDQEEIKHFWYALNKEMGEIGDIQTKDLSRMYYIPAKYDGANNFIHSHEGELMNPDKIMAKHKFISNDPMSRWPEAIRKGIIEHTKKNLNNTSYTWTGYKDCPFVNQRKVEEYKALSDGWYYSMYQLMVSIAGNAISKGYPITSKEVEYLIRDLDSETGNWYHKRPISKEAERAIEFVFSKNI